MAVFLKEIEKILKIFKLLNNAIVTKDMIILLSLAQEHSIPAFSQNSFVPM